MPKGLFDIFVILIFLLIMIKKINYTLRVKVSNFVRICNYGIFTLDESAVK